jgi:hypothetical protein
MTERENEETRKRFEEDYDFASARISDLARFIGFGLTALVLVLASSESEFAREMMARFKLAILGLSAVGCMIILLDYLQYVVGYEASQQVLTAIRHKKRPFNKAYLTKHRLRQALFRAKQGASVLGALGLIVLLVYTMVTGKAGVQSTNCLPNRASVVSHVSHYESSRCVFSR